jgi:hypothetical protein
MANGTPPAPIPEVPRSGSVEPEPGAGPFEPGPLEAAVNYLIERSAQAAKMTQGPFHAPGGIDQAAGGGMGLVGTVGMPGDLPGPVARFLADVLGKKSPPAKMTADELKWDVDRLERGAEYLKEAILLKRSPRAGTPPQVGPLLRQHDAVVGRLAQLRQEMAARSGAGPGAPAPGGMAAPSRAVTQVAPESSLRRYDLLWGPERRVIGTVWAASEKEARRMTPRPYRATRATQIHVQERPVP